jgi:4-amino-4-deoxy-L-arabinose transferase-like glycosyltransferase
MSQSGSRFSSVCILSFDRFLVALSEVPLALKRRVKADGADRIFAAGTTFFHITLGKFTPTRIGVMARSSALAVAASRESRTSRSEAPRRFILTPAHPRMQRNRDSLRGLAWAVLVGWSVRLFVVGLVYKGFLDPRRDYWEFGYEIGRVARSIDMGQGFSNPYWADTGPTALLCPVYPYLMASVFAIFGVYTKASALVFLALNSFFSAITAVPIYFIARKGFDLRTAKLAAWVWTFFPYAIYFSAATMWYHSFTGLLLASLFLFALSLASSNRLSAWAGFGVLIGFAALTNPVILGVAPFLGGWLWMQLVRLEKRVVAASSVGLLAMAVTILPWAVRNDRVLHRPVLFKDGFWMEVCVGNLNNSLHWWDAEEHPSGSEVEREKYSRMGEISYMAEKRRLAMAYIEHHPRRYAVRSVRHVVLMWTGFWSFNRSYLQQEPYDPENIFFLSSVSILSLAGLYHRLRDAVTRSAAMAYLVVLLSFPMPYYLSHLDPGFRHPVDPLLTILACSAIMRWFYRPRTVVAAEEVEEELAVS